MKKALVRPVPQTALQRSEDWAALGDDQRKQRAAKALRDGDRETLAGMLESYLLVFGRRGLAASPHTLRSYRWGLRALMDFCELEGLKPHQFKRQEALRFRTYLQDRDLSPATVNARLASARAFVKALTWAGAMDADPFAGVTVKDPTPPAEKRKPYTRREVEALLDHADDRETALVLLASDGGLRVSEVAALTWKDTDLPERKVTVKGKGGKRGTVILTSRTAEALAAWRDLVGKEERFVFPGWERQWEGSGRAPRGTPRKRPLSPRRIEALFAALCKRADVEHRGYHALRHSAGTRLYESTRDIHVVARHLRHAQVTTASIYAHLADDDYRAAVDRMAQDNAGETRA